MKIEDLWTLTNYEEEPQADRLRLLLKAAIEACVDSATDTRDAEEILATHLGYARPNTVRLWIKGTTRIPLDRLPDIAEFTGVPLSIWTAFWMGREAEGEHAEALYQAVRPKVTDNEFQLILRAREAYLDPAEVEGINR